MVLAILQFLWLIIVAFITGIFFMGIGIKMTARLQRRVGPPIYQPFIDIMKLMGKETNISHGYMMDVAIMMLFGGTIMALFLVPNPICNYFSLNVDIIAVLYAILVPALGMALGVGTAANPSGSIGISRALMMLLGYDFVYFIAIVGIAMFYGTTDFHKIVAAQRVNGIYTWNMVRFPLFAIAGFIGLLAMMGKKPFEVMVAPHEIGTGPMVEFGGKYMGIMFTQYAINIFLELLIYVNLFMGGAAHYWTLVIKMLSLFVVLVSINGVWGRFRVDGAIKFFWKWPATLAIINLIIVMLKLS